jgi:hypothetical protein
LKHAVYGWTKKIAFCKKSRKLHASNDHLMDRSD